MASARPAVVLPAAAVACPSVACERTSCGAGDCRCKPCSCPRCSARSEAVALPQPWPVTYELSAADVAQEIVVAVRAHRFRFHDEDRLQEGLAACLTARGLPVEREVRLNDRSRIDLLVGRVGVEVKVQGSPEAVLRQVTRYLALPALEALVLVTTRARHRLPHRIAGKPCRVVWIAGAAL